MHKTFAVICGLCLSTISAFGFENPEDVAMRGIKPEAIRAHVKFLADDLLEGRGTGARGYDIAAKYIAAQFEAMGLEPAGVDGTFFQPIHFRSAVVVPEETTLKVVRNGQEETLIWGQDYYSNGDVSQSASQISGQIVYVGYGVTAPDFGIDDFKALDVRSKIIAFIQGAPASLPQAERAHYGNMRTKLDNAAAHGAIGAIRVWDSSGERAAPFAQGLRASDSPTMAWLGQGGSPNGPQIRRLAVMSEAGTKKLFGGALSPDKTASMPALDLLFRTTSRRSEVTSSNVAAVLRGSDTKSREEYVVYTAHADHLGIGQPVNGDSIYNGAADNALGTAALIEIARAFAQLEQRPQRSVLFLAVTGEEKGLLGSDYFAEYPTVPRSQITANVNMDGVNARFDFREVVMEGSEHSSLGQIAAVATSKMGLKIAPDLEPEQQYFVRSDQYSFVRRGIPAIWQFKATQATDSSVDAAKVNAEYARSRYHMPSDDLNQIFDWQAAAKSTKLNFLIGYLIAQDPARPNWNAGDFFGKTFGNAK